MAPRRFPPHKENPPDHSPQRGPNWGLGSVGPQGYRLQDFGVLGMRVIVTF